MNKEKANKCLIFYKKTWWFLKLSLNLQSILQVNTCFTVYFGSTDISKKLRISHKAAILLLLIVLVYPLKGWSQSGDAAVEELVKMGFENVSCTDTDAERVYILQNTTYQLQGVGMAKAVDVIQSLGMPNDRNCRIVVLDNNIPQYSLVYQWHDEDEDGNADVSRADWEATYELGDSYKVASKTKKKNRSLFKTDIVVYPKVNYRNYVINKIYTFQILVSPAVEVSLWPGNKLTGQVIFPILNEYGDSYGRSQIRQGYITLSQDYRWKNLFLTGTFGTFNNMRWGADLQARYVFKDPRFALDGEIAYTGTSWFENWRWKVGRMNTLTWSVGGSFYWPRFNVKFDLHAQQYLLGERGIHFQFIRQFRYAAIGFYAMKVFESDAANHGLNGGFRFAINLPPYKFKRKGYVPRVLVHNINTTYNAGNERNYGKSFAPRADRDFGTENSFNPIFIKSELLNY